MAFEEDVLARVMAAANSEDQGLVIVCARTWYGGTVSVLTSVVFTSSPSYKQQESERATCVLVYCGVLENGTFPDTSSYAKLICLGLHYKSSKFVMEI